MNLAPNICYIALEGMRTFVCVAPVASSAQTQLFTIGVHELCHVIAVRANILTHLPEAEQREGYHVGWHYHLNND